MNVGQKLSEIESRLMTAEAQITAINDQLTSLAAEVAALDDVLDRITDLEARVFEMGGEL